MKGTGWRELRKRMLALGIAAVMAGNTVDLSVLPVLAQVQTEDADSTGRDADLTENVDSTDESTDLAENLENTEEPTDQTEDTESTEESVDQTEDAESTDESADQAEDSESMEEPADQAGDLESTGEPVVLSEDADETQDHWYQLTLPENITLSGTEDSVKEEDGNWYGLAGKEITVGSEICIGYGTDADSETTVEIKNNKFTMPSENVTLQVHQMDDGWKCKTCEKIDLALAYEKGALKVKGLEGRTFDTWPQMLTRVVLVSGDGAEQELIKPTYKTPYEYGNSRLYNAERAQYYVDYNNYTNAYTYRPEDEGFEADKAPKATITGLNNCFGTVEIYYTIGKGTIAKVEPQVYGAGEKTKYYDGDSHRAWINSFDSFPVYFTPDDTDTEQKVWALGEAGIKQWKSDYISFPGAINGNAFKYTLYYRTDKKPDWIMVRLNNPLYPDSWGYFVTNAGSYPFYLKVTDNDGNCEEFTNEYTAVVQPANLSDSSITVKGKDENDAAYYTGNEVTPNWGLQYNNGKTSMDLVNGTDYTVSYENNTDPGTVVATYTGKGNYAGTRTETFEIKYAFVPKQSTASAERWYNNRYLYLADISLDGEEGNSTIYRASAESGAGLSASVSDYWIYENLQDAVHNYYDSRMFNLDMEEGVYNKDIYIRERFTGCIGQPVTLTLHVDRTAPYWTATDGSIGDYGIQIKNNWFQTILNKVSFGHIYNDTNLEVKIRANDAKAGIETSGVDKYYYYIDKITDPSGEIDAKTIEELDALRNDGKFTEVAANGNESAVIPVSDSANFVVYAYAVDKAGNQSNYISSDGVIFDKDAPVVQVKEPSKADGTLKDTEVTLKVNLSEDATLMWFFVSEGVFQEGDN